MMIEVNLLPAELRRVERTPLPRFLVIIIGTAAVLSTAAFGVVVNMKRVPDLEIQLAARSRDIQQATVTAAAWDKLQDEIGDAQSRKQAIAELWRTRILWSSKLSQLAQIVPGFVGFTEVRLEENRGGPADSGGMFTIESLISGSDLDRVAQWRKTLQGNKAFFSTFLELLATETTLVSVREEQYVEKEARRVSIKLPIKTPAQRMAEANQALQDEMNPAPAAPTPVSPLLKPGVAPQAAGVTKTPAATPASIAPSPAGVVPAAVSAN